MTALELKNLLAKEHLLNLHRIAFITESAIFHNADAISVTSSLYTHEYEIKLSVGDLRSEARAIRVAKQWVNGEELDKSISINSFASSKLFKHRDYLAGDNPKVLIPNEFSFFVPPELEDEAKLAVQGTPYGVVLVSKELERQHFYGVHRYIHPFYVSVKPKKLHTNKLSQADLVRVVRRTSIEGYYLREKLINKSLGTQGKSIGENATEI